MLDRKFWRGQLYGEKKRRLFRSISAIRMTKKRRSVNFFSRVWSLEKKTRQGYLLFFPPNGSVKRRGHHATAHRARSNCSRCPEAEESEQTLRKPFVYLPQPCDLLREMCNRSRIFRSLPLCPVGKSKKQRECQITADQISRNGQADFIRIWFLKTSGHAQTI